MRFLSILSFLFICTCSLSAQEIQSVTFSDTIACNGSTIVVNFSPSGSFSSGNTFIAQLSDSAGTFSNFKTIGSTTEGNSITCKLPEVKSSQFYKIRVISSEPAILSEPSQKNLFIKPLPKPVISISQNLDFNETNSFYSALTNTNIYYKADLESSASCTWTFPSDASEDTIKNCITSAIKYSTEGEKVPVLTIKEGACTSIVDVNNYLKIYSCNPVIPSEDLFVAKADLDSIVNNQNILVCPGVKFASYSGNSIYVETGGSFKYNYIQDIHVYVKKGSSATMYGYVSNPQSIIIDSLGSVDGSAVVKLNCPDVQFDYRNFICNPCLKTCDPITSNETEEIKENLQVSIDPATGFVHISPTVGITEARIYNSNGIMIKDQIINVNFSLNNYAPGIYFVRVLKDGIVYNSKLNYFSKP